MPLDIGDKHSVLFQGLSGFWQKFFKDAPDLEAYYQAAEIYLGQAYLDLLGAILNIGVVDTPIFNKEYWKLFAIKENEVNFSQGPSVSQDRYVYDMPGDIVITNFLQNSIFEPDVLLEREVDFDVEDNDGIVRFYEDPFRTYQDAEGNWLPTPGVAWRSVNIEVGNQFIDEEQTGSWEDDQGVRRGDDLRVLAHRGKFLREGENGQPTAGQVVYAGPGNWLFNGTNVGLCKPGDTIQVYNTASPEEAFDGFYIVKEVFPLLPDQVSLEATAFLPTVTSTIGLNWRQYLSIFQSDDFKDYEIEFFDQKKMIGPASNPFPLDLEAPLVYAVVRDVYDPQVVGVGVTFVDEAPIPPATYPNTVLGVRHLIPGTVVVNAVIDAPAGTKVVEGIDYSVDYWRGIIYQLTPWDADRSAGTCNYQYREEVMLAAGGQPSQKTVGTVKQVSYWVPEVWVDRFTLWYNYGSLLNRFDASSEAYQAFLRGIMHLYMMGPILERIESALNVAAEYPVVKNDGEILQGYDDGVISSGADGTIDEVAVTFNTPSYTFGEIDVGGTIVFPNPLSDANKGHFRILSLVDANTVVLETEFGFVSETPVDWVLTHTYERVVTTDQRTYTYPYYVPIREDVQDSGNYGTLTFEAFEPLTWAFTVTDYIEDPRWWHNKYIPRILWDEPMPHRRLAITKLYENVITPVDDLKIGDPGFFIGADDQGNVFTPNDNATSPGVGDPVNLYRHTAAFILFDRYMKLHMFLIEIDENLELDQQFSDDLQELILVAKPSYTYPYVESDTVFSDEITLTDEDFFSLKSIFFYFGGDEDGKSDSLFLANNELKIGDADFPWAIGDYFLYDDPGPLPVPGAPNPVTIGYSFTMPFPLSTDRALTLVIHATVGGEPVLEGRDYTVNWFEGSANEWEVTALTNWDLVTPLNVTMELVSTVNVSTVPIPNTVLGWTPIFIGGLNPFYIRSNALDPDDPAYAVEWALQRTEHIDRPVMLKVNDGGSYTYP